MDSIRNRSQGLVRLVSVLDRHWLPEVPEGKVAYKGLQLVSGIAHRAGDGRGSLQRFSLGSRPAAAATSSKAETLAASAGNAVCIVVGSAGRGGSEPQ